MDKTFTAIREVTTMKSRNIKLPDGVGIAIVGTKKTAITCFRYVYLEVFRNNQDASLDMLIYGLELIDKFCRKATLAESKYLDKFDATFPYNPNHSFWILPSHVLRAQEAMIYPDDKEEQE